VALTPFSCPQCLKKVGVPPNLLGRWITCPRCGMQFAALADDAGETPEKADATPGYSHPRQPPAMLVAWGLLAVLILVTVVAAGVAIIRRLPPREQPAAQAPAVTPPREAPAAASPPSPSPTPPPPPAPRPRETPQETDQEARAQRLTAGAEAVAAAFLIGVGVLIALGLAYVVGVILLLAWVARDARCRGVDGGAVWVLVILFTHWLGLLVYLASRPHGVLAPCPHCLNKKLAVARLCPHCGRS
jgi:hypothetical protein